MIIYNKIIETGDIKLNELKTAYIFCKSFILNQERINKIKNDELAELTKLKKLTGMSESKEFSESLYIAADSGLDIIKNFDIVPDVIIGDFDSLNPKVLEFYKNREYNKSNIKIITHPAQKNDTDSMLAVKYALETGYSNIIIIGGTDGRIDHTLANLLCLRYIKNHGGNGYITDGCNRIRYISNGKTRIYRNYKYISIIPLNPEIRGVTLTGFFYSLKNASVNLDEPYTVCNEIAENCVYGDIEISDGEALICECNDYGDYNNYGNKFII